VIYNSNFNIIQRAEYIGVWSKNKTAFRFFFICLIVALKGGKKG